MVLCGPSCGIYVEHKVLIWEPLQEAVGRGSMALSI